MYELQAWVTACRTYLQTDMGSYLLRSGRDESLLLGDLHLTLVGLTPPGLDRPGDLYVIVEVDSYGHYFKRAKSRIARGQAPTWGKIRCSFHLPLKKKLSTHLFVNFSHSVSCLSR